VRPDLLSLGHEVWSPAWSSRPKEAMPVPAGLNWDLWIGRRPCVPTTAPTIRIVGFLVGLRHGHGRRRGVHILDSVFWAFKGAMPATIDATSCGSTPDLHPLSSIITYEFPAVASFPRGS